MRSQRTTGFSVGRIRCNVRCDVTTRTSKTERSSSRPTSGGSRSLDDLSKLFGGETYTIEDEDFGRPVDWLTPDEDDTLTFNVRETLESMDYPSDFVEELRSYDLIVADDGVPERTELFAEFMRSVWDSKGAFDADEDRSVE